MQRFKQALEHVQETGGRLRDSDIQLHIYASPQYYKRGVFDPETLGAASIVMPPPTGIGPNTPCTWSLNFDSKPSTARSIPGLTAFGASVRAHPGKSAPELEGRFHKFVLDKPPVDFLVGPASNSSNLPYVLMHMPRRGGVRVVTVEPTTAVDDVVHTPADAPPTGAGSEITPDESTEDFFERLSLAGAATNAGAGTGSGKGVGSPAMAASAACPTTCSFCGKGAKKKGAELKRCSRCKRVWYCGAECQNAGWKGHKKTCMAPLSVQDFY